MDIGLECSQCGSKSFSIPEDHDEDQNVYCAECQAFICPKDKLQETMDAKAKELGDSLIDGLGLKR